MRFALCLALLFAFVLPPNAQAHALNVAVVGVVVEDADRFSVEIRFHDAAAANGMSLEAPDGCVLVGSRDTRVLDDKSHILKWRGSCRARIPTHAELRLHGTLAGAFLLTGQSRSFFAGRNGTVALPLTAGAASIGEVCRRYFALGVEHILLGVDHLLFVTALLLLVTRLSGLVYVVTAFTLAHSITLALASLGILRLPAAPIEACIALSIAWVAREALQPRAEASHTSAPWAYAFVFGLFHGFGFAGALGEIGFPRENLPLALFAFNIGVECGQLAFVAALFLVRVLLRRGGFPDPRRLQPYVASAIGILAAYWFIERSQPLL